MAERPGWRVSAVIPAYNRADFLAETIGSILAQTEPPDEIIVVDDGSTDHTPQVVAGFAGQVRSARIANSGAPVARNVGAAMAGGDWLWFCDSDDLWRPEYLARCRALASADPGPRYIFGDFRLVRGGTWEPTAKFQTAPPGYWDAIGRVAAPGGWIATSPLYRAVLAFQPIFHSTLLVRRDFFQSIGGYDERFARTGSEDFEFVLRCAAEAPAGVVEEPLVGIRRHPGNFSGDQLRSLLGEIDILQHARSSHPAAALHGDLIEAEITRRTLEALDQAFAADDFSRVGELARRLDGKLVDRRSRLKIAVAGLPPAMRAPLIQVARLRDIRRAATA